MLHYAEQNNHVTEMLVLKQLEHLEIFNKRKSSEE
jgi:hypothetical protein